MNEETKMLLKLVKENTEYKVFFNMLVAKIEKSKESERMYMDIDEIIPLVKAFENRNKEISVITFDNCSDLALEVEQ